MNELIAVAEKNGFGHSEAYSMVYDALAELRRDEVQGEDDDYEPTAPEPAPDPEPAPEHECEECDLPGIHGMSPQPDGSCEYYFCEEHYNVVGTCFGCGIELNANWDLYNYPNADGVTFRDYCRPCGRYGDPHYYSVEEHDEGGFTTEDFVTEEDAQEYFDNLGNIRKELLKVYKDNSQNDETIDSYDPDEQGEESDEEDPDRCVMCDRKVEIDGDECMHCCNWNCDKMVCGKSGCSSQLAFFECCQECEAEAREQGEESDEEDPDRCVRCDRTFNQRKTIFNDGDCAFAWELHCDSGDDEGDLCATCLQKWVDEVKANGEWNRLAEL
jgi:hypothetical protein